MSLKYSYYTASCYTLLMLVLALNLHAESTPPENSTFESSPNRISSNPAAVNVRTGSGALQQWIERQYNIEDNHGINFQGAWVADTNGLFQGGIPNGKKLSSNSVGILDLTIDMERFIEFKGGLFSVQFLQQNSQNTNQFAGVTQGYNSLPNTAPFDRSELYALWYRQSLFDERLFVRVGKSITTLDFNNVVKPVQLSRGDPDIPAITGLIYTPIFINPAVDGVMPGYTNTAYGISATFTPVHELYLSYGIYDGNLASGKQTGLTGPTFNGRYFQVGEVGSAWLLGKGKKPGTVGVGVWRQTGLIAQNDLTENGATGAYLFGSQRLWYRNPGIDASGISFFYQYSISNSTVLSMTKSIGAGLTAFGLIGDRKEDSLGAGFSLAWLNPRETDRSKELMLQVYYQAKIFKYLFLEPAFSYVPTPGKSTRLRAVTAGTLRGILLL